MLLLVRHALMLDPGLDAAVLVVARPHRLTIDIGHTIEDAALLPADHHRGALGVVRARRARRGPLRRQLAVDQLLRRGAGVLDAELLGGAIPVEHTLGAALQVDRADLPLRTVARVGAIALLVELAHHRVVADDAALAGHTIAVRRARRVAPREHTRERRDTIAAQRAPGADLCLNRLARAGTRRERQDPALGLPTQTHHPGATLR